MQDGDCARTAFSFVSLLLVAFCFFVVNVFSVRHASSLSRPLAVSASRLSAAVPLSAIPQQRAFAGAAKPAAAASTKCPDNYNDPKYEKYVKVPEGKKIVILGFGAIGSGVLPLLFRHIDMKPEQLVVVSDQYSQKQRDHAATYGVQLNVAKLTKNDYTPYLEKFLNDGDFLVNLSVDVSSCALIEFCQVRPSLKTPTCLCIFRLRSTSDVVLF